jgi:hypothetical protein
MAPGGGTYVARRIPLRRAPLRGVPRGGPVREAAVDVAEQASVAGFLVPGRPAVVLAVGEVVIVALAVHLGGSWGAPAGLA